MMQDIKIIVDGVEVYAHEHVASTPPVNSPPVSGAPFDHMLFVDDYRTATDVDDQSAIELAVVAL